MGLAALLSALLTEGLTSFVDRDMVMRYLGGGVGHRGAAVQRETIYEDEEVGTAAAAPADGGTFEDSDFLPTSVDVAMAEAMAGDDGDAPAAPVTSYDDGEEDYGYEGSEAGSDEVEASDDSDDDIVDELGAEDGEENLADLDDELGDMEGYAPF